MLTIRQEKPEDYRQVEQVVEQAFARAEHTDHDEHNLVARLRGSEAFIPELSLVAEQDGRIVGTSCSPSSRSGRPPSWRWRRWQFTRTFSGRASAGR